MADRKESHSRDVLERAALIALSAAALVIAAILLRRELWPPDGSRSVTQGARPIRVENFAELLAGGIRVGDPASRVTIVECADFECPFCRRFHETYSDLQKRFGNDLSLVFIHYPLESHRFARPAARASECAAVRGRFGDYARLLYQKQDSLGLKSWNSFAFEAGVRDTLAFAGCLSGTLGVQRIENGLAMGKALGLRGTPTLVVNGWMYAEPPSAIQLQEAVQDLLKGGVPKQ